mmetsp:Transcript_19563/g.24696  ORF Transcript_19563/g.24696 Transcript_19563/m.24696 type:complete len:258 (-) Transcript_19563:36-809(-)
MGKQKKWTKEEVKKIITAYKAGHETGSEIKKYYNWDIPVAKINSKLRTMRDNDILPARKIRSAKDMVMDWNSPRMKKEYKAGDKRKRSEPSSDESSGEEIQLNLPNPEFISTNVQEYEPYEPILSNFCTSATCTEQVTKIQSGGLPNYWYLETSTCVALIIVRVKEFKQRLVAPTSSTLEIEYNAPLPPDKIIHLVDMPFREAIRLMEDKEGKNTINVEEGKIQQSQSLWKIEFPEDTNFAVYTIPKVASTKNYSDL